MDGLTEANIKKLKVKELKAELLKRNLSTKGNKKELAIRLTEAVEDEGVEVEEEEMVDAADIGCEIDDGIAAGTNDTFTIGRDDLMNGQAIAEEPNLLRHQQQGPYLAEQQASLLDTPLRGADTTVVVRTLYQRMKRYDEKLKESEEENVHLRNHCTEQFSELSREVKILKEKNISVVMESELLRERSRRMEIEMDLLKEKNMMLETVMKKMKHSCEDDENVSREEPFIVPGKGRIQGEDEKEASAGLCRKITLHQLVNTLPKGGKTTDVIISDDNHVHFQEGIWSTIVASTAVIKSGNKCYYEVTFIDDVAAEDGSCEIGWCTHDFLNSEKSGYVGNCPYSYGFNGTYQVKLHNKVLKNWGVEFLAKGGRVLGVAADMIKGNLLYGLDGDWCAPMGIAFENINNEMEVFPAITGANTKIFVNFGEVDFRFRPPDSSYKKLGDIL